MLVLWSMNHLWLVLSIPGKRALKFHPASIQVRQTPALWSTVWTSVQELNQQPVLPKLKCPSHLQVRRESFLVQVLIFHVLCIWNVEKLQHLLKITLQFESSPVSPLWRIYPSCFGLRHLAGRRLWLGRTHAWNTGALRRRGLYRCI